MYRVSYCSSVGLAVLAFSLLGCADGDKPESEVTAGVRQEFVDNLGNRWTLVGKANIVDMAVDHAPSFEQRGRSSGLAPEPTTVEELAESLRARTERDGYEYVSEPNYEVAKKLLAGHLPDATLPSESSELTAAEAETESAKAKPSGRHNTHAFIGADNRISVGAESTSYPYAAIGAWTVGVCTGTMIGASSMITAAHCLHDGKDWYAAPTVRFPSGATFTACWNRSVRTPYITGTAGAGDLRYDIGVIEFSSCGSSPGSATGWLGTWNFATGSITGTFGYAWGYPQDKTPYPQLWGMGSTLTYSSSDPQYVFQTIDGHFGQSGSGVYRWWSTSEGAPVDGRYIGSIYNRTWDSTKNAAARIDGTAAQFIIDYTAL